jgi:predicted metal-dependent hydrolase
MEPNSVIDKLVRTRRRTLSLQVMPDARLVVRAPRRASLAWIYGVVNDKLAWVREKQLEARRALEKQPAREFADGEKFLYLGGELPLNVIAGSDEPLAFTPLWFSIGARSSMPARQQFETWYRERARPLIAERVDRAANTFGLRYNGLRISGAATRWGSCSSQGSLNFSWRLVMAPLWVIDYVIAHELAHLTEHNHSRRFWKRVEAMYPNFKEAKRWLNANQARLKFATERRTGAPAR